MILFCVGITLGFFLGAAFANVTRNRRHADVVAAWQYRAIGRDIRLMKGGRR